MVQNPQSSKLFQILVNMRVIFCIGVIAVILAMAASDPSPKKYLVETVDDQGQL